MTIFEDRIGKLKGKKSQIFRMLQKFSLPVCVAVCVRLHAEYSGVLDQGLQVTRGGRERRGQPSEESHQKERGESVESS